jgi:hypothetical protein
MSNDSDILLATGALAVIGTFIIPMVVGVSTMEMDNESARPVWRWVIGVGIFLTAPFVWRVWLLAVLN